MTRTSSNVFAQSNEDRTSFFSGQKVDVIIPVFNGQEFILEAIRSIESQTVRPARIIIIDDGSTDRTADIVRTYSATIPIIYLKNTHRGLSSARNYGISQSQNDYIGFLDADDVWYPKKLEAQLAVFRSSSFSDLGLVYCDYSLIDDQGQPTDKYYHVTIDPTGRGRVFNKILGENKIVSSASGALVRRTCFERSGLFDEKLTAAEDWDMWLRIAQGFSFDFVDQPLVKIRRHGRNMQKDSVRMFTNRIHFFNKWLIALPATQSVPRQWGQFVISTVLNRLPRTDFYRILNQELTPAARKKLQRIIQSELMLYFLFRIAFLPFSFVRNLVQPRSEVL